MAMRGASRQVMVSPKSSSPEARAAVLRLVELRLEGSAPSDVTFSEPCYLCGNWKRRCLLLPTRPRKRRLIYVLESAEISPKLICCSASLRQQVTLMPQRELLPAIPEKSNSTSSANSSSSAPREMHCSRDKESNLAMAVGSEPLFPTPNKEDGVKACITCPRCGIINVVVLRRI